MEQIKDKTTKKSRIKILFKSGNTEYLEVDELKVVHSNGQITQLTLNNSNHEIMYLLLSNIEAIFEIHDEPQDELQNETQSPEVEETEQKLRDFYNKTLEQRFLK